MLPCSTRMAPWCVTADAGVGASAVQVAGQRTTLVRCRQPRGAWQGLARGRIGFKGWNVVWCSL